MIGIFCSDPASTSNLLIHLSRSQPRTSLQKSYSYPDTEIIEPNVCLCSSDVAKRKERKLNQLPWLLIRKPFSIAWKHGSCNLKEHPRGRGVERRKLIVARSRPDSAAPSKTGKDLQGSFLSTPPARVNRDTEFGFSSSNFTLPHHIQSTSGDALSKHHSRVFFFNFMM
jgi:hypothetical protein